MEVDLPQPFNKEDFESTIGEDNIIEIDLSSISGDKEAFDELLDFINDKVDESDGLQKLIFTNWKETVPEIESDVLMCLTNKTSDLRELHIQNMTNVSDQV